MPLAESLPPVLLLPPSPEGEDELSDEVDEVDVFEPLSPDVEPDDEDELSDVVDVVVVLVPLSPDVEDGLSVGVGMVVVFDPLSPDGEPDGEPGSEDEVSPELAGGAVEKLVEADGSGAGVLIAASGQTVSVEAREGGTIFSHLAVIPGQAVDPAHGIHIHV